MEDSRRCFRVVDSILVERNVGEVKKALQTEKENVINPTGIEV
jgi:singapore isolate B (sub-type 7) whole genome shotgun sequence assembly, scaffold_0